MTLLIYFRCRDGCILISDRQEWGYFGRSPEVQKCYLSRRRDYVLAGAGDGIEIDFIFNRLERYVDVNGENVKEKLEELIDDFYDPYTESNVNVYCILLAWEAGSISPYKLEIHGKRASVRPINADFLSVGIEAACAISDYLMKKFDYLQLPWEAAVQHAISVMKEVSREVVGVGRLENFGFDIIVILNDGNICDKINYRRNSASIAFNLNILNEGITSEFEFQQIITEREGD